MLKIICACALLASPVVADEFRLGSGFGDNHVSTRAIREVFAPKLEEMTGHTVSIFANSELGPAPEMVNQAQSGINFGVYVSSAFFNSQVPEIGVSNMPFVFPDRETAFRVFDGPFGEGLKEKFADKGLIVLGFMELGFRQLTNSVRPIASPEDLEGLKIRLQSNPVHIATFRTLGASPATIDGSELFAALSQGIVDGQENPYSVINNLRLVDAGQQYITESGHFFDVMVFAVSRRVFEGLSPEDQAAVLEAGRLATLAQREQAAADDAVQRKILTDAGLEITALTPEAVAAFRTAAAPVEAEVRASLGDATVDGFLDALEQAQ
ncbi:TRAP transporter substrate-binding protein [Falsirhodobacter xinxiangensis]|uniref:TRAP transporter substrate-binding protein n=1 Tax=Falsirhodobacter xinxiangensis TaxID=2530049 RepID=UPI0010A9E728|nr:TRAP transporter substrate-binding protein [Rhodobacter xinxiangensis]